MGNSGIVRASEESVKRLLDKGQIIESTFEGFLLVAYPNGVTPFQRDEIRAAFFGGAAALLSAMRASWRDSNGADDRS